MRISKATVTVMVVSCKATKSGKGYLLTCLQQDQPLSIFSKTPVSVTVPASTELTVDINCYVDRATGEFKEFISVS